MDYDKALDFILRVVPVALVVYLFIENRWLKRSEREKDLRLKELELQNLIKALGPIPDFGLEPIPIKELNKRARHKKLEIEIQHLKKLLDKIY